MQLSKSLVIGFVAVLMSMPVHAKDVDAGINAYKSGSYSEALKILVPLANAGDNEAQRIVGEMCYGGQGTKRDLLASFKWNELSAEGGNKIAQYNLGYLYERGEGVMASRTEAIDWYTKAASQGYVIAQHKLGDLYAALDSSQAIYWYNQARLGGDELALKKFSTLNADRERVWGALRLEQQNQQIARLQAESKRLRDERRQKEEQERERQQQEDEEKAQARAEQQAMAHSEAADTQSTSDYSAAIAAQILKKGAENAALLNRIDRQTNAAVSESNRVQAAQAAERARARTERGEREADRRRDAQRERAARADAERATNLETQRVADMQRSQRETQQREERSRQEQRAQQEGVQQRELQRQRDAADQLARVNAEKAMEQKTQQAYLAAMRQGIHLVATKCPDNEGHYYATGTMPKIKGDSCIDVHYQASCPGSRVISNGVAKNFLGMNGCFGDTYQLDPKPACPVKQVQITVQDVRLGCN